MDANERVVVEFLQRCLSGGGLRCSEIHGWLVTYHLRLTSSGRARDDPDVGNVWSWSHPVSDHRDAVHLHGITLTKLPFLLCLSWSPLARGFLTRPVAEMNSTTRSVSCKRIHC